MEESEQLEKLREWAARYWFVVALAATMILSTIVGWTHRESALEEVRAHSLRALFSTRRAAAENDLPAALAAFESLDGESFAELKHLAAFSLAALQMSEGDIAAAEKLFAGIIAAETDEGMRAFAVLRLSEIHINREEFDAAELLLKDHRPGNPLLAILFDERLGDSRYANGDFPAAQEHYFAALSAASKQYRDYAPILNAKIGALLSKRRETATDDSATEGQ